MFKFSPAGIKNPEMYSRIYSGFIEWCKQFVTGGTFSTYCDGEPVCLSSGIEISYRNYLDTKKNKGAV